jgi:thioredoxin 1
MSSEPFTPDFNYIGQAPVMMRVDPAEKSSKCTTAVCKVLLPILVGACIIVLGYVLYRLFTKKGDASNTPAPAPTPPPAVMLQANRPFARNVPTYPVQQDVPQGMQQNNTNLQYSAFQNNSPLRQVLDQRYVQMKGQPYNDNKMQAYQSYGEAVGNAGLMQNWDEAAFNKHVLQSKMPALVAFTSQNCGHCVRLKPAYEEAAKNAKIVLAMVERSGAGNLPGKYNVKGFPTIILFNGGEAVKEYQGDRSVQSLVDFAK